jgi:hypothetical protein
MVRLGLNACFKTFRTPQLQRFVAQDFGNPKCLDEFQPSPKGGMVRAVGPELLVHVWAGNVPGLPLWSLISGFLVKAPSVGKVSSAEPLVAHVVAQVLAEVEPRLAPHVAVVWFQGGDAARERGDNAGWGDLAHAVAEKVGDDIQLSLGFHLRFLRKPIFSIAATSARCLAGACASQLRIQWTQQRWCVAS